MTVVGLKREIDEMFPCKWENVFEESINKIFDKYINIVSNLDNIESNVLDDIKYLCNKLSEVINLFYDGRKGEAFSTFSTIMNGDTKNGLFSCIGIFDINPGDYYFRARERKIGVEFSIHDMFHIPLNKRGIVSMQRYSSIGYPCLYLGNTIYSCWEEMRRCSFNTLMFSAYKVRHKFSVFDVRIPDQSDYTDGKLFKTLRRIPLVLACSFAVKNYNDVFKPEYIIPQMLVETVICNNRKITQYEKSAIDSDVIWGIIYTSTHISKDFPYGKSFLENIVLPVIESNNPSNYCYCLASLFDISQPLCYEFETLKDNSLHKFVEIDKNKTDKEKIEEQYKQSKMGYLEWRLKNSSFTTLPHIVVGCPSEGIILDQYGTPISIIVRSSEPFKIE